jgi:hypothetical protein
MKFLLIAFAAFVFTSCSNADTTASGNPADSARLAIKDSLANIIKPTSLVLDSSVQRFMAFNKAMQFDSITNYIYPTVYKYIPKSQVIQGLSILKVLDGIELRMDSANVLRMDSVVRFSSGEAARMDYALKLIVTIRDSGIGKQISPQVRNMIVGALKSSLGTENVVYNDTSRTIAANIKRQAIAISDTVSKGWKFIALENNAELANILPAEIRDRYLIRSQPVDTSRRDTLKLRKPI